MMFWRSTPQVTVVVIGAQAAVPQDAVAPTSPSLDPDAVRRALKKREEAADEIVRARRAVVAAQAVYSNAYLGAYISEGGPEHLRKAIAEDRCSVERAALAAAEVDELAAEEGKRVAELGWRSAMAGAAAPEAGE